MIPIPAMNRWAIFGRPLRGLTCARYETQFHRLDSSCFSFSTAFVFCGLSASDLR